MATVIDLNEVKCHTCKLQGYFISNKNKITDTGYKYITEYRCSNCFSLWATKESDAKKPGIFTRFYRNVIMFYWRLIYG